MFINYVYKYTYTVCKNIYNIYFLLFAYNVQLSVYPVLYISGLGGEGERKGGRRGDKGLCSIMELAIYISTNYRPIVYHFI
jgi:hypothetical protein